MLRITLPAANRSGSFILEGRLTGLWAKELLRVARAENQGHRNIFDLREVFYVDSEGENTLRWLGRRGAKFVTDSAYGKDLCHRLKLRRVEELQLDNRIGSRRNNSHTFKQDQGAHPEILDPLAAADVNHHPSSCRG